MTPINKVSQYQITPEGGRALYFYPHYLILKSFTWSTHRWFVPAAGVADFHQHKGHWFFLTKDGSEFQGYLERFIAKPLLLKELEDFLETTCAEAAKRLSISSLAALSDVELRQLVAWFYGMLPAFFLVSTNIRWLDRAFLAYFRRRINEQTKADEMIRTLAVSDKETAPLREERELLKLAVMIKEQGKPVTDSTVIQALQLIHDRYCWSSCGYYNELAKNLEWYQTKLGQMIEENPQTKLDERGQQQVREDKVRLQALAQLDAREQTMVTLLAESTYLKDQFKFCVNEAIYRAEPLFAEIARRTDYAIDQLKDLLPEEVDGLLAGEALETERVAERIRHNVLVAIDGELELLEGVAADEFGKKYLTIEREEFKEFRGRGASSGKGRGKVKIITSVNDFHKMQKGDILVAINTSPDYVPIMRQAAAIVAEEGGITAHVSVVSRELGIPSVVGVRDATKIFKDGDMVEVDADKGIVRKL